MTGNRSEGGDGVPERVLDLLAAAPAGLLSHEVRSRLARTGVSLGPDQVSALRGLTAAGQWWPSAARAAESRLAADRCLRPILYITSNSERRLPGYFLRCCVYHHIRFEPELLERVVAIGRYEFEPLPDDLIALAIRRFPVPARAPGPAQAPGHRRAAGLAAGPGARPGDLARRVGQAGARRPRRAVLPACVAEGPL